MTKCYNSRVKERNFLKGCLMLRKAMLNTKDPVDGSLGLNWEGKLVIFEALPNGAYEL